MTMDAWSQLLRSERGVTLPAVIIALVVGLGLSGAAVMASTLTQRATSRDHDAKTALAAADAGVELALYRQNKVVTNGSLRCVTVGSDNVLSTTGAQADGWCPPQTGSVGDASFTYRTRPWTLNTTTQRREMKVVSIGATDGASRRIAVTATARHGTGAFGDFDVAGLDFVEIEGSSNVGDTDTPTNAATNGDIIFNGGSAELCGDAQHGIGRSVIGNGQCIGYSAFEGELDLAPVDAGSSWTTNDNGRFFGLDPKQGNVNWQAATKTLTMKGNATLTLGGSTYSFCKLDMEGSSQLIVAQGAAVTIIFHSPETCGMAGNPVEQLTTEGNSRITTTSTNPGDLKLVMVGSPDVATIANLTGNSAVTNEFVLYGPRTDITLWGNATYIGAVAGKSVSVGGSALVLGDDRATGAELPIAIVYKPDNYLECVGAEMPSPPDSTC